MWFALITVLAGDYYGNRVSLEKVENLTKESCYTLKRDLEKQGTQYLYYTVHCYKK